MSSDGMEHPLCPRQNPQGSKRKSGRRREIRRSSEDAVSDKKKANLIAIPDGRLPFYKASAYGIRHPDSLPFEHT